MRGLASIINMFIPTLKNESKGIYPYGVNNMLPNEWLKFIADSGTASRAADKFAEYVASDGFIDESVADSMANKDQTFDELLQEAANYIGMFQACAFHVSRRNDGTIAEVKVVPYQCVRKQLNGSWRVNLTLGQPKFEQSQDKTYKPFYGPVLPVTLLQEYHNGEIICLYKKSAQNPNYSFPNYYAGIEDVRTSAELCKMDLELALNGFMPSAMITMCGDFDDTNKDENGKTEVDHTRDSFKTFTGQVKNSDGMSGRFKAWLTFAKTKDEIPVLQTLDVKSILESSNTKRDVIDRSVCRLWGVHPVLLGYSDAAVLGNTQALSNASTELNKTVNPYQRMITSFLEKCFPEKDFTISEYTPIQYIDPSLFAVMTEDEIRNKLLGLPPKETEASQEGDKILKALNSLSPLVANKVLESLTPDEIRALIGAPPKNITDGTI